MFSRYRNSIERTRVTKEQLHQQHFLGEIFKMRSGYTTSQLRDAVQYLPTLRVEFRRAPVPVQYPVLSSEDAEAIDESTKPGKLMRTLFFGLPFFDSNAGDLDPVTLAMAK